MSISVLSAAKHIGVLSDWSKTNLELQKIIYLAHMIHLGENGLESPLVQGYFEAWDFGPVHPDLYHKVKIFGAGRVRNIFHGYPDLSEDEPEAETLTSTYEMISNYSGSRLIAITHWENGAWYYNYDPDYSSKIIPNEDILKEYNNRVERDREGA